MARDLTEASRFRLIAITWSTGSRSLIPVIAIALGMAACGPVRLAVLNPR